MATTTRQIQRGDLTVEIELSTGGRPTVTAWRRYGRDQQVLFEGVATETLQQVVDLAKELLAPEDPVDAEIARRGLGPAFGAVR